ncbi:hypothetical protein KJ564_02370, partial [bacterium]|nr:hypothetical protein [bacterium]
QRAFKSLTKRKILKVIGSAKGGSRKSKRFEICLKKGVRKSPFRNAKGDNLSRFNAQRETICRRKGDNLSPNPLEEPLVKNTPPTPPGGNRVTRSDIDEIFKIWSTHGSRLKQPGTRGYDTLVIQIRKCLKAKEWKDDFITAVKHANQSAFARGEIKDFAVTLRWATTNSKIIYRMLDWKIETPKKADGREPPPPPEPTDDGWERFRSAWGQMTPEQQRHFENQAAPLCEIKHGEPFYAKELHSHCKTIWEKNRE